MKLSKEEVKAIEEFAAATKLVREYIRAQMLLYKAKRMILAHVAHCISSRIVQKCLDRYEEYGDEL